MGTRHTGPILTAPRLRVPARRRQLVTAAVLLVGVLGVTTVVVLALLPREDVMVLRSWEEAVVTSKELVQVVEASGELVTPTEELVSSPEAATVAALAVRAGSRVRAGDTLAYLSSPELELELESERQRLARTEREIRREGAESDYAGRKTELELERLAEAAAAARLEEEKTRRLAEIGALGTSSLEQAVAATVAADRALQAARLGAEEQGVVGSIRAEGLAAERDEAQDAVRLLRERIASLVIRSPIDGSVVAVEVRQGQHVLSHALLFTVADTDNPSVDLRVPENQASRVKPGQAVSLTVATTRLAGVVQTVGLVAEGGSETQAATVEVRVALTPVVPGLIAGSTVSAEIAVGTRPDALTLPRGPWLGSGEARYVYRVEGDVARRVAASFGATRGQDVEVLAGLEEGDRVLVSSYQVYRDREMVRLERSGE